jgi:hypothetical protein
VGVEAILASGPICSAAVLFYHYFPPFVAMKFGAFAGKKSKISLKSRFDSFQ